MTTRKKVEKIDRDYRNIDTLEDFGTFYDERAEVNRALKACGYRVRNYKLQK